MPEWSIVISGPAGSAQFNPNPQEIFTGDSVSWSNRTNDNHTIVIGGVELPAPSWGSSSSYKPPSLPQTYTCKDHSNEGGRIILKTAVLLIALVLAGTFAPRARAQVKCSDLVGGELLEVPKIDQRDARNPIVRGTLVTSGEKELIGFVADPNNRATGEIKPTDLKCAEQWVRTYRKDTAANQDPGAPASLPMPGPTIRAKVGDLIELTFLNLIDPLNFPGTDTGKCDVVEPGVYPRNDTFPNCFHGSVFTNVHFHGTHTSPNSTGDNVFLELLPSPRSRDNARTPRVTAESVSAEFQKFFGACESNLNFNNSPQQWPRLWTDLPETFRNTQDALLMNLNKPLYDANQNAKSFGAFPQNYVGAFPYCFRLPVYTSAGFPPEDPVQSHMTHTEGAGSTEMDEAKAPQRKLIMGQAPGTHWYHAHKHGSTTLNVSNGMTGVMIIEGKYDEEIKAAYQPGGIKEQLLVLNQLGVTPRREGGSEARNGAYFSINGRIQPTITMHPGEVQWWRIANTSGQRGTIFVSPKDLSWRQLAQDGVQFNNTNYVNSQNKDFYLASGNRADLLVKAPNTANGTFPLSITLSNDPTNSRTTFQVLLYVKTDAAPRDMPFMDRTNSYWPPFLTDIKDTDVNGRKSIVFKTVGPNLKVHTIDGKKFTGEVGALVLLNQVEEWTIYNEGTTTAIAHPFHIHINPFQVVEVFDPNAKLADGVTPVYTTGTQGAGQCQININDKSTWKPCGNVRPPSNIWWDVFAIPYGRTFDGTAIPGYFKLRSRFVDYSGYYVIHCHILSHEDTGMMTVVNIAPLQPPFSHH